MSHILWTFSPSSEPYLRRCIEAASLQDTDNKWTQKFGRETVKISNKTDVSENKILAEIIEIVPSPEENGHNDVSVTYEEFFESIENDTNVDYIARECSKNPELITKMSQRLSTQTVEKLFKHIFSTNEFNKHFLSTLLHDFLPKYIKYQYSWLCIDLLVKTCEYYPEMFQKLLKTVLEDTEIPNQVVHNYVTTLTEDKSTDFMSNLMAIELSFESFQNNILAIYTAYKDCIKTEQIQDYMRMILLEHSKSCSSDRNYGRLFLAYLQAEKSLGRNVNVKQLEECLEIHISPFKRPCMLLIKDFNKFE